MGEQGRLLFNLFVKEHIQNTRHELIMRGVIPASAEDADVLSDIATVLRSISNDTTQHAELNRLMTKFLCMQEKKYFKEFAW